MAPKQKTFELIPDLPGIGQAQQQRPVGPVAAAFQSRPPMTTKQAKKLYRQKGKGPKLSKAEQRRIDLMEQDRIRKEFEKERAQARARAARDKKKAREEKDRDEKKKKGMPLFDVHPSQDTISRFISRLGSAGKKHTPLGTVQEAEQESATEAESESGAGVQERSVKVPHEENRDPTDAVNAPTTRPAKRRKVGRPSRDFLDSMIHIPSQRPVKPVARLDQEAEKESWPRPSSTDTDDSATETMLEDQLIADVELASSRSAKKASPNRQSSPREPLPPRVQRPSHALLVPRPPSPRHPQAKLQPPRIQEFQQRHATDGTRVPLKGIPHTNHPRAKAKPIEGVFKKPTSPFVPGGRQSPAALPSVAVRPPALPRFKPPAGDVVPRPARPTFLPRPAKAAPTLKPVQASPTYAGSRRRTIQTADTFPTSTQLLVINHMDELFPSPSQEARELCDDQQSAKTTRVPTSPQPSPHAPLCLTDAPMDTYQGRPPVIAPGRPTPVAEDQPDVSAPAGFPFLATQDLVLSSQDIEELDKPSKVGTESAPRSLHVASHADSLPSPPERTTLPSDGNTALVSGLQAPNDTMRTAIIRPAGAIGTVEPDCRRRLPTSGNELGPRTRPPSQGPMDLTKCPTHSLIHPRSQRHQALRNRCSPSRSPSQKSLSTSQERSGKYDAVGLGQSQDGFEKRPPSLRCTRSPAKHTQARSHPGSSSAEPQSQNGLGVPTASFPKKRMFGSSGPGAAVLIAMERSYRYNLSDDRRREEELFEKPNLAGEYAQDDFSGIAEDNFLDDELDSEVLLASNLGRLPDDPGSGAPFPASSKLRTNAMRNTTQQAPEDKLGPRCSPETDYGDFDFEAEGELGMLADAVWADYDLSGI